MHCLDMVHCLRVVMDCHAERTCLAGRTDNSASSTSSINSAQAEAETLNLRQRSAEGRPGLAPARDARLGLSDEPTVMVNRAVGRLASTSTLSSLRQGPRRLGKSHSNYYCALIRPLFFNIRLMPSQYQYKHAPAHSASHMLQPWQ